MPVVITRYNLAHCCIFLACVTHLLLLLIFPAWSFSLDCLFQNIKIEMRENWGIWGHCWRLLLHLKSFHHFQADKNQKFDFHDRAVGGIAACCILCFSSQEAVICFHRSMNFNRCPISLSTRCCQVCWTKLNKFSLLTIVTYPYILWDWLLVVVVVDGGQKPLSVIVP